MLCHTPLLSQILHWEKVCQMSNYFLDKWSFSALFFTCFLTLVLVFSLRASFNCFFLSCKSTTIFWITCGLILPKNIQFYPIRSNTSLTTNTWPAKSWQYFIPVTAPLQFFRLPNFLLYRTVNAKSFLQCCISPTGKSEHTTFSKIYKNNIQSCILYCLYTIHMHTHTYCRTFHSSRI